MAQDDSKNVKKITGRPKRNPIKDIPVDEKVQDRLDINDKNQSDSAYITIEDLGQKWKRVFNTMAALDGTDGIGTVATQWNKLNPFLQNQRIKNLYSQAQKYNKTNISQFLENPANSEVQLRGLSWANSSSQQIYYNILRRAADVPVYNYYIIPELLDHESDYKKTDFSNEDRILTDWLEVFNVANTFKTIALEVKREGKSSYLLRNRSIGEGKSKKTLFTTLQKLPTDWLKITGKGQLGYTVSFNMAYFLNIANSPSDFGDFMIAAWKNMTDSGVVTNADVQEAKLAKNEWAFNLELAKNYSFTYQGTTYSSSIEAKREGRRINYMFWLQLPFDLVYTFGSDNSQPWVAPDTMGLMLKLQELTDYGQLAGLIASTPLTAVLTGEIETVDNPRAGKNESVFSPEVLQGYMQQFNAATSTNVEAWLWPAKNIQLQQLSADVNSSSILSEATQNFIDSAGEGGLTIATEKPNVAQINVAKQLAASQQKYVTLQFENVMNYIIQHKLGLKYHWKIQIWGDIFNNENDKKFLKEVVASGNIGLFPKLMSAEGISMRDTKALVNYLEQMDFYKKFKTYTQESKANDAQDGTEGTDETEEGQAGRPPLAEDDIDNENTAASRDRGDNISDNRESK